MRCPPRRIASCADARAGQDRPVARGPSRSPEAAARTEPTARGHDRSHHRGRRRSQGVVGACLYRRGRDRRSREPDGSPDGEPEDDPILFDGPDVPVSQAFLERTFNDSFEGGGEDTSPDAITALIRGGVHAWRAHLGKDPR